MIEKTMTIKEEYKRQADYLKELEDILISIMGEVDNYRLTDIFKKWQLQRNMCNELYITFIENELNLKNDD